MDPIIEALKLSFIFALIALLVEAIALIIEHGRGKSEEGSD